MFWHTCADCGVSDRTRPHGPWAIPLALLGRPAPENQSVGQDVSDLIVCLRTVAGILAVAAVSAENLHNVTECTGGGRGATYRVFTVSTLS